MAKLSTNENLWGPSPRALESARAALEQVNFYPEHAVNLFSQRLAERLGVETGRVALGNGSDELIYLLAATYLGPGDPAVIARPPYRVHEMALQFAGANITYVPLKEWRHDLEAMARAYPQPALAFVTNPHNPTGTLVTEAAVRAMLEALPNTLVALDEAYLDFADADTHWSAVGLTARYPNLVVLRTFSKLYGLAGLRLGYAVCHPQVAETLNCVRPPYSVNAVALAAATGALDDEAYALRVQTAVRGGRRQIQMACRELGVDYVPSQANFVLIRLSLNGIGYLMRHGVIVRPGENLGLPEYARVTVGKPEQIDYFIRLLNAWLANERRS